MLQLIGDVSGKRVLEVDGLLGKVTKLGAAFLAIAATKPAAGPRRVA